MLNAALLDRSEQMVTLMTDAIDAGALDDAVRHPSLRGGDFFTLMHNFKGESAASGALLVAAWLRRRLALLTADGAYNQPQEPTGTGASSDGDDGAAGEEQDETAGDPASTGVGEADETVTTQEKIAYYVRMMHEARARLLLGDSMSAPEILASLAAGDPVAFSRNILPVVRQASAASRTGRTGFNGERDEAFGEPPEPDSGYDANQALLVRLAQAVEAAAGQGTRSRSLRYATWLARRWPPSSCWPLPGSPPVTRTCSAIPRTGCRPAIRARAGMVRSRPELFREGPGPGMHRAARRTDTRHPGARRRLLHEL